jgi:hypothetical protein
MEKVLKAHVDAMWARLAEENAKREKLERERVQQVTTLLTNFVNKDMPVALERGFKKEFAAIGPAVAQAVLPPLQNVVATTVAESFQVSFLTSDFFHISLHCAIGLPGKVPRYSLPDKYTLSFPLVFLSFSKLFGAYNCKASPRKSL